MGENVAPGKVASMLVFKRVFIILAAHCSVIFLGNFGDRHNLVAS